MAIAVWSAVIGLVFAYCVLMMTTDSDWSVWLRVGLGIAGGTLAGFLFDLAAFLGDHPVAASCGAFVGTLAAVLTYEFMADGLERRRPKPQGRETH